MYEIYNEKQIQQLHAINKHFAEAMERFDKAGSAKDVLAALADAALVIRQSENTILQPHDHEAMVERVLMSLMKTADAMRLPCQVPKVDI